MNPPLVRCRACTRTWHSRTMAEGLRTIGRCPRCGGALAWLGEGADGDPAAAERTVDEAVAPHLVLGVPRR
ncbi:MAG: hypothetical protein JWN65_3679 [Solirubrobacterales bacterium]|nr:hypothetical protein [Solirubrobacterales bacterium]